MAYIGNTPAENYASFLTETFTVSATASYTLSHAVANENDIRLVINGVVQQPGSGKAYTANNTTLTLTSATVSGDSMYAVYLGRALQTVNPPSGSVGTAQISSSARSTNLLNPSFEAHLSSDQSISNLTVTKVQFDTEVFDSNSAYDNSSNYRFTPQVAGKYFVYANVQLQEGSFNIQQHNTDIYKNGSQYRNNTVYVSPSEFSYHSAYTSAIMDLNGSSDYVEIFTLYREAGGTPNIDGDVKATYFGAYRIGE